MDCSGRSQQMIKPIKVVIDDYGLTITWRDGTKTIAQPDSIDVTVGDEAVPLEDLIKLWVET